MDDEKGTRRQMIERIEATFDQVTQDLYEPAETEIDEDNLFFKAMKLPPETGKIEGISTQETVAGVPVEVDEY